MLFQTRMKKLQIHSPVKHFVTQMDSSRNSQSLEYSTIERERREKLLKRRLANQILNSLDFSTILETAINEIRSLIRVECCQFSWYRSDLDPPIFEPIRHICHLKKVCSRCQPITASPLSFLERILLEKHILRIDDVDRDRLLDPKSRKALQSKGIKSLLAIVISLNSGEIGVLSCEHRHRKHIWRDREVELLQGIADGLAMAIDRSRLYEASQKAANNARLQASKMQKALTELASTQAQLIQTEKMSSLGLLVAGVAHEINNPINFIYGNLNPIREYTRDLLALLQLYEKHYPHPIAEIQDLKDEIDLNFVRDDFPKLVDSMAVGSTRIRDIVQSLRTFSRVDEADMKFADLHQGIDSTLLILQNRLRSKIEVVKNYGDLPLVECYPGQLNQVFMNIFINAIDALEEFWSHRSVSSEQSAASPTIEIATQVLPNNWISIRIADNGMGMSEKVRSKLFDPFFTTKPIGKGTGLGLSISYQIIAKKHQGKLSCGSVPGKGSEFHIEIPIQQAASVSVAEASKHRDAICFGCHDRTSCHVSVSECDRH